MKHVALLIGSILLLVPPVFAQTIDNSWTTAEATNQHNGVRGTVNAFAQPGPAGSNPQPVPQPLLVLLSYSAAIATTMDTWAGTCPDDHDPNLSTNCTFGDQHGQCGENLFMAASNNTVPVPGTAWTVAGAVGSWAGESVEYDYPNATCNALPCGHYTQIVHQASQQLGCAAYQCTGTQLGFPAFTSGVIFGCRYEDVQLGGATRPYCTATQTIGCGPVPVELLNFEIH